MTLITLYLWTVVAGRPLDLAHDWRPSGEFASVALCEQAKAKLGYSGDRAERARCIDTGKPIR